MEDIRPRFSAVTPAKTDRSPAALQGLPIWAFCRVGPIHFKKGVALAAPFFYPNFPEMKLYTYAKCDTCRKAVKWLRERGVTCEEIPIREQPPTVAELRIMLVARGGEVRRLFNTSGMDYRTLGIKDKLPSMTVEEALELLASNGNLIKRPFLLTGSTGATGFKETEWCALTGL